MGLNGISAGSMYGNNMFYLCDYEVVMEDGDNYEQVRESLEEEQKESDVETV